LTKTHNLHDDYEFENSTGDCHIESNT